MSNEYSAIAAKLHAMHSRFLSEKDYDELLLRKSVADVCAYLKTTEGYGELFKDTDERKIHRGDMELLLEQNVMDEYIRLYSFVDKSKRALLRFWFTRREIEFLKREIRYIYTHDERSGDDVNQSKFDAMFFKTHTRINRDIMLQASSISDCIAACEGTPYAAVLKRARSVGADLFSIDMLLDSCYYESIRQAAKKNLDVKQRDIFERLIDADADMLNLMWIYRGKKYYGFDSDIIFTYLIPMHYRINTESMRRIVDADSLSTFIRLVSELTVYGGLFEGESEGRFPEENYRVIYSALAKRIFSQDSESLAAVYAYLYLKEAEIDNITSIIEGIRYGLNIEAIRDHVKI